MLIAIDGNEANIKKRVGSNIYAFQILKNIWKTQNSKVKTPAYAEASAGRQNYNSNRKTNFLIFLKNEPLSDLPKEKKWWQYRVLKAGFLWTQWRLPLALFKEKEKPDVFFSPGHYAPSFCPIPLVISILDVSYLRFPSQFRFQDLWQLRLLTQKSARKADKILTISQASKDDIMEYYDVLSGKIKVVYPGVNVKSQMPNVKAKSQILKLKKKYNIPGDYIIYVGTLQPRKNLIRLIEAFKRIRNQESGIRKRNLKLVIVGKKGWLYDETFKKVKELKLENDVIFTGFVPDEDLPYLIKGSICLVLVSLYEGFGLPVAEAMSLGVPVVTSNVSSLPEVAGGAGILVNPYKVEEIALGIEKVVDFYQQAPEKYRELVKKSQQQVKKFSWEKCAQETLEVLKEVAIKNSNP